MTSMKRKLGTVLLSTSLIATFTPAMGATAYAAVDSQIKATYEAALEDYNSARSTAEADAAALVNAENALKEARVAHKAATDELAAAEKALSEIEATLEGSDARIAAATSTRDAAKQKADQAKATLKAKQDAYKAAKEAAEAAENAKTAAAGALSSAKDALASAQTANKEAADAYGAAQADATAKAEAAEAALTAYNAAEAGAQQAATDYNAAKQAAEAAAADVANAKDARNAAMAKYEQGSLGFFSSVGANNAVQIIEDAASGTTSSKFEGKVFLKKNGATAQQVAVDSTSLDNMEASFVHMKYLNDLRKSLGLSELRVSDQMMAYAQVDADYSDQVIGHAKVYNLWENLAWNWGSNPYRQWYDEEKVYFDKAVKEYAGQDLQLTGADAYNYYQANTKALEAILNGKVVGHYMSTINPSLTCTGLGVCTRGSQYGMTYAQVFYPRNVGTTYTLSNYKKRFDDYKAALDADIAAYDTAVSAKETADQTLAAKKQLKDDADQALADAAATKQSADQASQSAASTAAQKRTASEQAADALSDAQSKATQAQSAYDDAAAAASSKAKAEKDAKDARDAASDASDVAAEELQGAQNALEELTTSIEAAKNDKRSAESRVTTAQAAKSDAADTLDQAQSAYDQAVQRANASGAALAASQETYDQAKAAYDAEVQRDQEEQNQNGQNTGQEGQNGNQSGQQPGQAQQPAKNNNQVKPGKTNQVTAPRGTAITKAKKGKKKATITWKKQAKGTTGYQIRYSTDPKFGSAGMVTINSAKTTKKVIKKLKSKKIYYFQIRTYKKSGSQKAYSGWSGTRSVKVK